MNIPIYEILQTCCVAMMGEIKGAKIILRLMGKEITADAYALAEKMIQRNCQRAGRERGLKW